MKLLYATIYIIGCCYMCVGMDQFVAGPGGATRGQCLAGTVQMKSAGSKVNGHSTAAPLCTAVNQCQGKHPLGGQTPVHNAS